MSTDNEQDDSHRVAVNVNNQQKGTPEGDDTTDDNDTEMTEMSKEFDEIVAAEEKNEQKPEADAAVSEDEAQPQPAKTDDAEVPATGNKFNKYFLYTLIAGLIISALISVVAVLIGEFNSTMSRALGTTVSMVVHTFVALVLISAVSNGKQKSKTKDILINTLLLITIASFATSTLGTWDVIGGRMISDLYLVYFYTFSAVLWVLLLMKVGENTLDKATHITSQVGIGLTAVFYLQLLPTVFVHYPDKMPEFYYRGMGAVIILLATASILTTVFRRIYLFKHHMKPQPKGEPAFDLIVVIIVLLVGVPAFVALMATLASYNSSYRTDTYRTPTLKQTSVPAPSDKTAAVDCSNIDKFQEMRLLRYGTTYAYVSHDPSQKAIMTRWTGDEGVSMAPIHYPDTLLAVDAYCDDIDISSVRAGDTITLYLHPGYTSFYRDALAVIQKVD